MVLKIDDKIIMKTIIWHPFHMDRLQDSKGFMLCRSNFIIMNKHPTMNLSQITSQINCQTSQMGSQIPRMKAKAQSMWMAYMTHPHLMCIFVVNHIQWILNTERVSEDYLSHLLVMF